MPPWPTGRFTAMAGTCSMRLKSSIPLLYAMSVSEKAVAMEWKRKDGTVMEREKFHGKYVLLTSLDEDDEVNVW